MCAGIIVITIVPEVAFLSLTCIFIKIAFFCPDSNTSSIQIHKLCGEKIESNIWFRDILVSKATFPGRGD